LKDFPLVLASASSARARLLEAAGLAFTIEPAYVDEGVIKSEHVSIGADAKELTGALAEAKAQEVSARKPNCVVIGADQVLEYDGKWFDKAADIDEARRHLRILRGRTHCLVTTVCVVVNNDRIWSHAETARLTMRSFSDDFLEKYLEQGREECLTSVGAYQLEGLGAQLFKRIDGDHFVIQGLPVLPLLRFLRREGIVDE
jgi:septum formation protein